MRSQHEVLGKYADFPPWLRRLVQGPMPFLPWAINAARFVYWTMPAHHTALTAVLMQVNNVVSQSWQDEHADLPPGNLQYAIPNGKGGWIDLARYTPWGLMTAGGVKQAVGLAAPQFRGAAKAIEGQDPFGKQLQIDPSENAGETKPTDLQAAGIAGYSLLEALVPGLRTARVLREKGGTAYAGSTIIDPDVKPGTEGQMTAARRALLPLRPTYLGGKGGETEVLPRGGGSSTLPDDALDEAWQGLQQEQDAARAFEEEQDRAWRNLP